MNWVRQLGGVSILIFRHTGCAGMFLPKILKGTLILYRRPNLLLQQLYSVGVMSVLIVVSAGLFVGMMLGFQGYYSLIQFGAESSLGLAVSLFLTRELSPVLTALLFAGRGGSSLTAEIGLMKVTQQLQAMQMMAVNPIDRVIAPRFLAGFIAMPILAAMFSVAGLSGGYLVGVGILEINGGSYWASIEAGIDVYDDILSGMIKSLVFGLVVSWIAVFEGYHATLSAGGVSRATTRTVVTSSLAVLGLDYVMTAIMFNEG
jgi:phospholipid/cholesterol/gamma-HCH transport system permease protein